MRLNASTSSPSTRKKVTAPEQKACLWGTFGPLSLTPPPCRHEPWPSPVTGGCFGSYRDLAGIPGFFPTPGSLPFPTLRSLLGQPFITGQVLPLALGAPLWAFSPTAKWVGQTRSSLRSLPFPKCFRSFFSFRIWKSLFTLTPVYI